MKNHLVALLLSCFVITSVNAQNTSETFANKDNVIGVSFGIGGVYGFNSYSAQTPVFGAQYERGIVELKMGGVIGVGGFIGYKGYTYKFKGPFSNELKYKYGIVIIGARGNFHYDLFKVPKLDTYGGSMIAFHFVNDKDEPDAVVSDHGNAVYASIYAGARYYFAPQVSGFAEVGYGVSWLTMGMTFKF